MKTFLALFLFTNLVSAESMRPSFHCQSENVADGGYTLELFSAKGQLRGKLSEVTFAGEIPAYEGEFSIEKKSRFFGLFGGECLLSSPDVKIKIKNSSSAELISLKGKKPTEWTKLGCSGLKSFLTQNKSCFN